MVSDGMILDDVARSALSAYGLTAARIGRLGGLDTINYEVDAGAGERYVLRLYDPDRHDVAAILSEHLWVAHLAAETDLDLPRPVINREGETVTRARVPTGRAPACTLMEWIEGEAPSGDLADRHLEQAGRAMAHMHASRFDPPPGFVRPTHDAAHVSRRLETLLTACGDDLTPVQVRALARGTRMLEAMLRELPRTPSGYGLIHGDFHAGNYLVHDDRLCVIDFGRCAFAFHALDIAIALEVEASQRAAFLAGYASVRPLPEEFVEHERAFTAMAHLDNLAFLAKRPDERPFLLETLPRVTEAFGRWVDDTTPG
jgi:Ser/Thr protein kinase RdoA (MazF antagonist)